MVIKGPKTITKKSGPQKKIMQYNLVHPDLVHEIIQETGKSTNELQIREWVGIVNNLTQRSQDLHFIRMELGNPGLPAVEIGVTAQIEALLEDVAGNYPPINGIPLLKEEASRFTKNFLDLDVNANNCIPTVGSMQGCYASLMIANHISNYKDTTLFIDPGFPVNKLQAKILGIKIEHFDIYNYRGEKLRNKLEYVLNKGNIHSILYSNPNNPTWVCLTDEELRIIGKLATKYGCIVIEDLAYFGMDFRKDYSHPGIEPYQPSVGKYTDNYILMLSSSKAFSYAGERCAIMGISNALASSKYSCLKRFFGQKKFLDAILYGILAPLSSGTSHSAQYGLAAILKAVNDGKYNYRNDVIEYGEKASTMKEIFTNNRFYIVYDKDGKEQIADGFYFTVNYPGFTGADLAVELLCYGISCIPLKPCGSNEEGVRICSSLIKREEMPILGERLKAFHKDHPTK